MRGIENELDCQKGHFKPFKFYIFSLFEYRDGKKEEVIDIYIQTHICIHKHTNKRARFNAKFGTCPTENTCFLKLNHDLFFCNICYIAPGL